MSALAPDVPVIEGAPLEKRLYHVVAINEQTGRVAYMTARPCTHTEGCTIMSKIAGHKWRRLQLEEVQS